jgi:hypothetical protein
MLRVDQVHGSRHKVLVEEQSIRRVAREMGVSCDTVRKDLQVNEPARQESGPRKRPVLQAVAARHDPSSLPRSAATARARIVSAELRPRLCLPDGFSTRWAAMAKSISRSTEVNWAKTWPKASCSHR